MFFLHKKHLPQRNLYTQTAHRSFYRPTFWHAETLPRAVFTQQKLFRTETFTHKQICTTVFSDRRFLHTESSPHRSLTHRRFYTQKVLRTTVFTYRCFHTQMSLHRHKLHTETCAHSTRLHTANFYTERLCFPFLITYLSCSPSQIIFYSNKSLKSWHPPCFSSNKSLKSWRHRPCFFESPQVFSVKNAWGPDFGHDWPRGRGGFQSFWEISSTEAVINSFSTRLWGDPTNWSLVGHWTMSFGSFWWFWISNSQSPVSYLGKFSNRGRGLSNLWRSNARRLLTELPVSANGHGSAPCDGCYIC